MFIFLTFLFPCHFPFGQIIRVLRAYYLCALELVNDGGGAFSAHSFATVNQNPRLHLKDARLRIEEALGMCLLPSLQLIPANPAVGQEIWELMNLLPYEVTVLLPKTDPF